MAVSITEVITKAEQRELYRFRYGIYGEELGKQLPGMDHRQKLYTDGLDRSACIVVARDDATGQIVGTVRTNYADQTSFPQQLSDVLRFESLLPLFGKTSVSYTSALMIDPGYRGTTIASLLAHYLYERGTRLGYVLDICLSELSLVHLYYQLGYRPYAPACRIQNKAGLRLPLLLVSHDHAYLERVRSPFRRFCQVDGEGGGATAALMQQHFPDWEEPAVTPLQKKALWAGIAHRLSALPSSNFFHGFSEEEMQRLMQYMRRYPNIRIQRGERLFTMGEKERSMGLVLSGQLGITFDEGEVPHFVGILEAGALCGEVEALVGGVRSAALVALQDSEVLILPYNLFEVMDSHDVVFAGRLRMNLNLLLVSRLHMLHLQFMQTYRRASHRHYLKDTVMPKQISTHQQIPDDSYAISTLDDPVRELERLQRQAWMGRELEQYWLKRIGCTDNCTFLDLGSGPGLTSIMLAQLFPCSRFIGVEPDKLLRDRAREHARHHGVAERCTFVEGRGEDIPLEDGQVDYCTARFVFQHLSNPSEVLKELQRVTRPGGKVIILDVDDKGVIVHPEPEGFHDFQQRTASAQAQLGGDRHIGRKLGGLLLDEGFSAVNTEVVPVTSREISLDALVDAAFSFKEQTLKRMGAWKKEDQVLIDALRGFSTIAGAWMFVPIFLAHGEKAEVDKRA